MKISDIINESMGVGGVAVVAKPIGGMIKRNTTKKKKKKAEEGNKAQKGIPANATDAELKSARKAGGEKGQRAHWLLNMRKGNRKKK